jgi:hypothetical protein
MDSLEKIFLRYVKERTIYLILLSAPANQRLTSTQNK